MNSQETRIGDLLRLERLCDDFESSWRSGEPPKLEEYVKQGAAELREQLFEELLRVELRARLERGGALEPQEYLARFPNFSSQIHSAIESVAKGSDATIAQDKDERAGLQFCCPACGSQSKKPLDLRLDEFRCPTCGATVNVTGKDLEKSTMAMGRFALLARVGRGAFGVVWKAWDSKLDRIVALKVPVQSWLTPTELNKIEREARAVAKLEHEHIAKIYDVCTHDNLPILVCQFIDGESLDRRLKAVKKSVGVMPLEEAARIAELLADALSHAHQRGIIHRDLKPANVLLDHEGKPYLTDFGLAKQQADDATLTAEGQVLGTPAYMPPEQAQGDSNLADQRSDVYSLGAVLYEMITSERPFRGPVRMLFEQIASEPPESPKKLNPRVPRDLETITLHCLEKKPSSRYPTAAELRSDLHRFRSGEPVRVQPPSPWRMLQSWYPKHATLMLGAYYIVSPLMWVFFILGGLLETPEHDALRLASSIFLPWALGWICVGYLTIARGSWFEWVHIPLVLAFASLTLFIQDRPTSYLLIGLITTTGLALQVGAAVSRLAQRRHAATEEHA